MVYSQLITVQDGITLGDVVSVDKAFVVTDALNLADTVLVDKGCQVQDTVHLLDVVTRRIIISNVVLAELIGHHDDWTHVLIYEENGKKVLDWFKHGTYDSDAISTEALALPNSDRI